MYNIKGPSKIAAKTARRGISQNIDNYGSTSKPKVNEDEKNNNKSTPVTEDSEPKPIFQKKIVQASTRHDIDDEITPQHEDWIKFIQESWNLVNAELEEEKQKESAEQNSEVQQVRIFIDEPHNLKDFVPWDLELWWGRRLYNKIMSLENAKLQSSSK